MIVKQSARESLCLSLTQRNVDFEAFKVLGEDLVALWYLVGLKEVHYLGCGSRF
jgi:hypothetical protein